MLSRLRYAVRHPVSSNTTAVIVLRGSTMGARLLVLFVIARFVTPTEFGTLALILTITEIVKGIADFGVDTFAIREFAVNPPDQQRTFARVVAVTKLFTGMAGYTVLVAYFLLIMRDEFSLGAILGLLVLTGLWVNLYIDYFQAQLKIVKVVAPVMLNNLATLAAIAVLFAVQPNLLLGVALLPLGEAINALVLARLFNQELGLGEQHVRSIDVLHLLKKTTPLAVTLIMSMLYTRLDVLVLAAFFSTAVVGFYGVAFRLTEPFQLMAGAFAQSSYSYLSRALVNGRRDVPRLALRYGFGIVAYGLIVCFVLEVFAPVFIQMLLPEYTPAIPILRVLGLALVLRSINSYLTSVLYAYEHFKWVTAVAVANLFIVATMLLVLVPRWAAVGAALALLSGEAINTVVQAIMTRRAFQGTKHDAIQLEVGSA